MQPKETRAEHAARAHREAYENTRLKEQKRAEKKARQRIAAEAAKAAKAHTAVPPPPHTKDGPLKKAMQLFGFATMATPEIIRHTYRKLALRAHPDRGGTKEAFCALQAACDLLIGAATPNP